MSTPIWSGGVKQVAHAGGLYGGRLYTNAKQAILRNYNRGFRHFEIDLVGLADGRVITAHDGAETRFGLPPGVAFEQARFDAIRLQPEGEDYEILTLEGLCRLAEALDIVVVADVKNRHEHVYAELARLWRAAGRLGTLVPQAYDEASVALVRRQGFPEWLATMWGIGGRSESEKLAFCASERPKVVWCRQDWCTPAFEAALRRVGVEHVGVHGDMTPGRCAAFMRRGVHVMNDCEFIDALPGTADAAPTLTPQQATELVEFCYRWYLDRPADPGGLAEKAARVADGMASIDRLEGEFVSSAEYRDKPRTKPRLTALIAQPD